MDSNKILYNGTNETRQYSTYDDATGEKVNVCKIGPRQGLKKYNMKTLTNLPDELVPFNVGLNFIKLFGGSSDMLFDKLTNAEIAMLVFLSKYVCYDDCVLRLNGDRNGHALTMKELAQLHNMKPNTFRKIMSSLKAKRVIGVHETGTANHNQTKWITVNPYIMCRGSKVQRWVADFFGDTEWNDDNRKSTVVDDAIAKAQAETNISDDDTQQVQPLLAEQKSKSDLEEFHELFD